MSDTSEAAKAIAEYDVGDTKSDPTLDYAPEPAVKTEQPAADQPKDDVRPRNPDGTFAKAEQKPAHSKRVLAVARELGMSDADIDDADPDFLRDEVLTRLAARSGAPREEKPTPQEEAFELGLTEDDTTPEILSAFKKMQAHYEGKLSKLEAKFGEIDQREQRRETETATQQVDRTLAELDEGFYGKGALHTLKSTSAELGRRQAVVNEAKRLAGDGATRQQIIDRLEAAHKSLFGREPVHPEDPDLAKKKDAWSKGGLARPTAREAGELPKGEKRATVKVAELMRARNGHATEEDGIPE